jgi:hypothetical protein
MRHERIEAIRLNIWELYNGRGIDRILPSLPGPTGPRYLRFRLEKRPSAKSVERCGVPVPWDFDLVADEILNVDDDDVKSKSPFDHREVRP